MLVENVLQYLSAHFPRYLRELEQLVNVDSGSYSKSGVDRVGQLVRGYAQRSDWGLKVHPHTRLGDALEFSVSGAGRLRLLLLAHMDTVFPDGTADERPFSTMGNVLRGPGVSDMKSGLLAALYAVEALRSAGYDRFGRITFLCTSDEEIGSRAAQGIIQSLARESDVALVVESARPGGTVVSARKGTGVFRVSASGRAAHAGVEPENGANAVVALAHQVIALHGLNGLAPGVSVNVGTFMGGERTNVVPPHAVAAIDLRYTTMQEGEMAEKAIRQLARCSSVPGTEIHVEGSLRRPPMPKTEQISRLVAFAQAAAAHVGMELRDVATGGASDANFTAAAGVPSLDGLGPVGGHDHSPAEYVRIDSIVPRTAMLSLFMAELCEKW